MRFIDKNKYCKKWIICFSFTDEFYTTFVSIKSLESIFDSSNSHFGFWEKTVASLLCNLWYGCYYRNFWVWNWFLKLNYWKVFNSDEKCRNIVKTLIPGAWFVEPYKFFFSYFVLLASNKVIHSNILWLWSLRFRRNFYTEM